MLNHKSQCTRCKADKPLVAFHKDRTRHNGVQSRCKACEKARTQLRKVNMSLQERNRRRRAEYTRYEESTQRRASALFRAARANAKTAGVPFDLTPEWIQDRIEHGVCALSGLPLIMNRDPNVRVNPRAPSLDRIMIGGGYTKDNVRVVCWQANMARGQYADATLLELAEGIIRTISSQALRREGSETIPKGSRGQAASKRAARSLFEREDIVRSMRRRIAVFETRVQRSGLH